MQSQSTPVRKILHLDLDAFFCAVEELERPELQGKPFAVGGHPENRGVVASCSYPARSMGIHSAMPMSQALKRCPGLIIVSAHHGQYSQISRRVIDLLSQITPQVEQISIDEAFMDITLHPQSSQEIAQTLQQKIRRELSLPCSLGGASNKLVAKIATDVGKASAATGSYPQAIQIVPPGKEAAFLAPLPTRALWGVGPKTAQRLEALGIHTIGDIAGWPMADLIRRFGKHGADLAGHAQGIDPRPLVTERATKSVSRETTFSQDVADDNMLQETLAALAADVSRQLRRQKLQAATIKLKIRWPDFTTLTRQATLDQPTSAKEQISTMATSLLADVRAPGQPVRLIGVGVSGFDLGAQQPSLWDVAEEMAREEKLRETLDDLRRRFGDGIIQRGVHSSRL